MITSPDLCAERTADNLVSKADPEQADSVLGEDLSGEFDEAVDPGDIFEGVVFCRDRNAISIAGYNANSEVHALDPVRSTASISSSLG